MARWDFKHHHVQQFDNTETASQLGAKAVLISVGPPTWDQNEGGQAIVMGMVQNLTIQQQRNIMEIFEIGSERRYFVDNPHRAQINISRALISGPSILKIVGSGLINRGLKESESPKVDESIFRTNDINAAAPDKDANLWMNLATDLFNNPFGMLRMFEEFHGDGTSSNYGSVYLQNCKVQGYSLGMQSQMWMIQEDMNIPFEYAVPIAPVKTIQESYKKRKEIMEGVSKVAPQWYEDYANWSGLAPGSAVKVGD